MKCFFGFIQVPCRFANGTQNSKGGSIKNDFLSRYARLQFFRHVHHTHIQTKSMQTYILDSNAVGPSILNGNVFFLLIEDL